MGTTGLGGKESVQDCLSHRKPFKVLCAEVPTTYLYHFHQIVFVVFTQLLNFLLLNLVLEDLLKNENRFFHQHKVRLPLFSKLKRGLSQSLSMAVDHLHVLRCDHS
jgi:hypothetical protein